MFTKKILMKTDSNSMTGIVGNADVTVPLSSVRKSAVPGFTPVTRPAFQKELVVLSVSVSCKQQQTSKQSGFIMCYIDERNDTISLVEFCIFDSQLYQLGDIWESDTCTHCECAEGSVVRCSAQECSVKLPCWETEENNQCCPACKGNLFTNKQQTNKRLFVSFSLSL